MSFFKRFNARKNIHMPPPPPPIIYEKKNSSMVSLINFLKLVKITLEKYHSIFGCEERFILIMLSRLYVILVLYQVTL